MVVPRTKPRGAFILLEGVDRCGKTTQCGLLLKHLISMGIAAVALRFPDRTTPTGQIINSYLQNGMDLNDRGIHLLFSANRWEAEDHLVNLLKEGKTIVCDRYAYSGVAFSSAKEGISLDWCKSPDKGLPAPDVVLFLDVDQETAEKRGGFGGERYETTDFQKKVRQRFSELEADETVVPWHVIDAAQNIENVQKDINLVVEEVVHNVQKGDGAPLKKMWEEGNYDLSSNK